MKYAIRFDYPDVPEPLFAGLVSGGALGWAPTLATAMTWDDRQSAERMLENGYPGTKDLGSIVEVQS